MELATSIIIALVTAIILAILYSLTGLLHLRRAQAAEKMLGHPYELMPDDFAHFHFVDDEDYQRLLIARENQRKLKVGDRRALYRAEMRLLDQEDTLDDILNRRIETLPENGRRPSH